MEEVCQWGWALNFQNPNPDLVSLFLLPVAPDGELSAVSLACLPECCRISCCADNDLNL